VAFPRFYRCCETTVQGLTIDRLIPEGAPPRMIKGEVVPDIEKYYARHYPAHLAAANARVLPKPHRDVAGVIPEPQLPVMSEAGLSEL
jgi:hypothetical protein